MYDLCGNKQYGYQKACTHMAEMGILSSGRPFTPSTLKGISNPANIGKSSLGTSENGSYGQRWGKFLVLARTRQIIFLPMQFGRPGSARTFSSVPTSQGAAPLRCVMTDRFRIFLPVLSGVPSVAGWWFVKKRILKRLMTFWFVNILNALQSVSNWWVRARLVGMAAELHR